MHIENGQPVYTYVQYRPFDLCAPPGAQPASPLARMAQQVGDDLSELRQAVMELVQETTLLIADLDDAATLWRRWTFCHF